jgi:predicted transposase/invertase (TIGR01784 family)
MIANKRIKTEKFAKPSLDISFKKLFASDDKICITSFSLTKRVMNSIFEFHGENAIRTMWLGNPTHHGIARESILEVFCADCKGMKFIINVRQAKLSGFEKRIQYHTNAFHASQLATKGDYSDVLPVYTLVISDFKMFPNDVPCVSHHEFVETKTRHNFLSETKYTIVELPKYEIGDLKSMQGQWLYLLAHYEAGPPENPLDDIRRAFQILDLSNWKKEELDAYDSQRLEQRDIISKIESARQDGRREYMIGVALKLMGTGSNDEIIENITGLTPEIIHDLRSKQKK